MTEKSEQQASETGQDREAPEGDQVPADAKRDSQGVPYGTGTPEGQETYVREGSTPQDVDGNAPQPGDQDSENPLYAEGADDTPSAAEQQVNSPYSEGDHHVPDPTAMSGTLETSGTGGGANESLRGTTGVFEEAGLPSYRSTDVVSGDATGQPEPHAGADAQTAGAEPTSYQETTIAGAAPAGGRQGEAEGPFTTARKPAEGSEDDSSSEESKEDEKGAQEPSEGSEEQTKAETPAKQTAAAKKTAAKRTTSSRTQSKS